MPASPIPFVPSGHFPLTRGIGLSQGGLLVRNSSPPCERGEGRKAAGGFRSLVLSLPPPRGKVVPKGPDEGGYRGMRRPSNGRMGTSAPTQGYDRFRRGRCPQRPVDNGCTSVVPLIRHGLRPCHLLPCGAKALARIFGDAQMSMAFPSSVTAAPCHLPPGEGFCDTLCIIDFTFNLKLFNLPSISRAVPYR